MSIRKTKDGRYRIDVSLGFDPVTGKRKRKTMTLKTKKHAEEMYHAIKKAHSDGLLTSHKEVSFSTLVSIYLEQCKLHHKPNYYNIEKYTIEKHIIPHFENCIVKKVTHNEIQDFQKSLIDKGLENKTINNTMIILSKIFDIGIVEDVLIKNPCAKVKNLSVVKKQMKFWTPDQFKEFISLIEKDEFIFKVFYTTDYLTGMRLGEILALQWKDLDKFRREINVYKALTYINQEYIITPPKTKNSVRRISINSKLITLLDEWRQHQKEIFNELGIHQSEETYMFQYKDRPPTKDIFSRKIKQICQRGDVEPIRFHDLRHSHVALLIHQGEDYLVIKERLGHSSVSFTMNTYGHLFPNKQKETADRLDHLL
ncbi:tyrosine-type recombinase/integrase [Bacillus inaquosorum]|uniref:tyrosine-type recombinase/integrase n=1 Tax=Bacillus inaquosorum TaxID=483913 RepID=UPI00227F9109|nr:site-specific integrase [Bacillus inaquosorum]MCY9028888.1 site-specific integrase [Bacillus inaquosorum]